MGGAKGFGDMTGQRFGMKDGEGNGVGHPVKRQYSKSELV